MRTALLAGGLLACSGNTEPPRAVEAPAAAPRPTPHIIWLSLDTTRADAIGAWAEESHWGRDLPAAERPVPNTPVLDQLAKSGVRFSWALSHAPTTLSSHTTAFSGRDPHGHRVVRNGYPVPADIPLVPESLQKAGWSTRGVVGSSVLETEMGLSRGFDAYVAPEPSPGAAADALAYAWSANTVTSRALEQVDAFLAESTPGPLFLFAHYYDPHMPWTDAPEAIVRDMEVLGYDGPVDGSMASIEALGKAVRTGTLDPLDRRQARALYLAEVTGVDSQLGRLMGGLDQRGILDNALVVVMSDHGETLDDGRLNPYSHGPEVSLVDIHVPLILASFGPVRLPDNTVVSEPVGLIDLPATVCALAEVVCDGGEGIDLSPAWTGGALPPRIRYAEATKPMRFESKTAWNNLPMERSAVGPGPSGPLQLKIRPLNADARFLHRVAVGAPSVDGPDAPTRAAAKELLDGLAAWDAAAPAHRDATYDDETRQALIELGYLDPEDVAAPE